ncbi:MAG: extensin family protein, partial [Hyphomicrobiaceae bacterium]
VAAPADTATPPPPMHVTIMPKSTASWPVTLHDARADRAQRVAETDASWSQDEVDAALKRCAAVLKAINGVAEIQEPIRDGSCGTPAPIKLISFGRKPEVVLSPPAIINCDMAEALHMWVNNDLQPLARKHLGAPLVKIEKMSDYSCRNAYGRARGKLSEHGRANALDISGFTTARGDTALLMADWGMTARDIRRQIAEAQKQKDKAQQQANKAATTVVALPAAKSQEAARRTYVVPPSAVAAGALPHPASVVARQTLTEGVEEDEDRRGGRSTALSFVAGERPETSPALPGMIGKLGGFVPRVDHDAPLVVHHIGGVKITAPPGADKALFLRNAHETACKVFGTVLGPEANNAHRNHFHIDLAERGASGAFCQ